VKLTTHQASSIAAWKVKLMFLRYRVVRHAASLRLASKNVKGRVYLWPPFAASEQTELEAMEVNLVHFLRNLNTPVVFFRRNQMEITRCIYSVETHSVTSSSTISEAAALQELRRARYCLMWRYQDPARASSLYPWLYSVAGGPGRFESLNWLRLVSDLYFDRYTTLPNRAVPFPETFLRNCAILGTGPSLDDFMNESECWDAWIGANTVVCDDRIWGKGRPFAFCALDPNNCGPTYHWKSMWAGAFRLLRETPALLVTLQNFAPYIELNFPDDIKRKCYYVKALGHDTYRMTTRFSLSDLTITPFGNVLTDLMLPLAASITRRVTLYGCDGRPPGGTMNFPKSAGLQKYDDEWLESGYEHVDENQYSKYMDMHSLYTRYVVDECINHGVQVTLRRPSWNIGLAGVPVCSPQEE